MTSTDETLIAIAAPIWIKAQLVQTADGEEMTVVLDTPREKWGVMLRQEGRYAIVAILDKEADAQAAAEDLAEQMSRVHPSKGGTLQ